MYDVTNILYYQIVSPQMETGNVPNRSNNISVSTGLQNVMDRYGTDQKQGFDIMETQYEIPVNEFN